MADLIPDILATFLNKVAQPLFPYDLTVESLPIQAFDRRYSQVGKQWGEFTTVARDVAFSTADLHQLTRRMVDGARSAIEADPRIVPRIGSFTILVNDMQSPTDSTFMVAWKFLGRIVKKSWLRENGLRSPVETSQQEFERITGSKPSQ